jgi:hypothetical protein
MIGWGMHLDLDASLIAASSFSGGSPQRGLTAQKYLLEAIPVPGEKVFISEGESE